MKAKVLIVDDEPDVLASTAGLVEALGYEAISVSKSAEILDAIEREKPNVLLQDLKMPGLNVSGLVAALRSNPDTAQIPIVFFSANADVPGTAARYDAWGYLSKPFSKADLGRLLREATGAPLGARAKEGRALTRELRAAFHDYWNLLAALSNYIVILDESDALATSLKKTVRGLDDVVLQLESKTDRLQSQILSAIAMMDGAESNQGPSDPIADPQT